MIKKILFIIILLPVACILPALTLLSGENTELDLTIELASTSEFNITDMVYGFGIYSSKNGIRGTFFNKIGYDFSFDVSKIDDDGITPDFLNDLYVTYIFSEKFSFSIGHMMVPVGEEQNLSPENRGYIYHSKGSVQLLPDYKNGFVFNFTHLWNILGLDIGLFDTLDINSMENYSRHIGFDVRFYLENSFEKRFHFKTGAGCFIDTAGNIYQSDFFYCHIKTTESQTLSLFCELDMDFFLSYSMDLSLFSSISYRIKSIEPVVTFEWFDKSITNDRIDDSICLNAGINYHAFGSASVKNNGTKQGDILSIRSMYKYDRKLVDDYSDHSIVIMFLLSL